MCFNSHMHPFLSKGFFAGISFGISFRNAECGMTAQEASELTFGRSVRSAEHGMAARFLPRRWFGRGFGVRNAELVPKTVEGVHSERRIRNSANFRIPNSESFRRKSERTDVRVVRNTERGTTPIREASPNKR